MNYNEFIKAVDEKLATMSESDKEKWIHNLARTIQEDERCKFLNSLNGENNSGEIIHDIKEIQEWCEKIQNGDIFFECSYCEVYGENYWRDDSYEYHDTYEIGKKLTSAFQVAEDLLYQKEYEKALGLYDLLIDRVFQAYDSDSEETMELGIEELVDEKLVSLNLKKIVLNLLYAKYQTSNGKDRVQVIYNYIKLNILKNIKLEEFFILYLNKSRSISKAGEKLIENLKYRLNYSNDDDKSFVERFFIWKDKIIITSGQYEKYITWLNSEVDKRTDAVVGGGFRGSYYKAALLISALGETMESQGNVGAKINIIEHYKKIHSRKRAFKGEFEDLK